jgi:hypothetical protein
MLDLISDNFFSSARATAGKHPWGRLFNVTFPGPAWLNGGELGTEASIFMVPAAIATLIYVIWFLRSLPPDGER